MDKSNGPNDITYKLHIRDGAQVPDVMRTVKRSWKKDKGVYARIPRNEVQAESRFFLIPEFPSSASESSDEEEDNEAARKKGIGAPKQGQRQA